MVSDLPDYEKKVIVVTVPGEYPGLVDINHKQILGVTLKTPSVAACLPISIEHTVLIDHRAILGEALKTPTFANCIPTSIENDAIAYDAANDRFKVDLAKISATDVLAVSATDLDIRNLTATDIVTVNNLLNPHPVSLSSIPNPSNLDVALSTRIKPADLNLDADKDLQVDVKTLPTISQSTKHDSKTYKTAVFDASASGNLVDAVADKVIKLHALTIQAQGTVTVNLNNGSGGSSLMEWSFQAREGAVVPMANAPAYWAKTSVNTALYVTLSAAVVVTITAIYSDDDSS
jgi:hypothetical protein